MHRSDKIVLFGSVALIAAIISIFLLLNNSTAINSQKRYKVTVIVKSTSTSIDFWKNMEDGIKTAAEEFNIDYTVEGTASETMVNQQIDMVNRAIDAKPDAILLAACDYKLLAPCAERAVKSGITLIAIDSDIDYNGKASLVATDNTKIGVRLGELLDKWAGTSSKYIILEQLAGTKTAIDRVSGVKSAVKNSDKRLVGVYDCASSSENARKITRELLKKDPDIKGIVATNEVVTLGVVDAIKSMGLAGKVDVIACDSSIELIKNMEAGVVQEFVVQRPFNMGYMGIKFAYDSLLKKEVPSFYDTGSVEVNKKNMFQSETQKLLFSFNSK